MDSNGASNNGGHLAASANAEPTPSPRIVESVVKGLQDWSDSETEELPLAQQQSLAVTAASSVNRVVPNPPPTPPRAPSSSSASRGGASGGGVGLISLTPAGALTSGESNTSGGFPTPATNSGGNSGAVPPVSATMHHPMAISLTTSAAAARPNGANSSDPRNASISSGGGGLFALANNSVTARPTAGSSFNNPLLAPSSSAVSTTTAKGTGTAMSGNSEQQHALLSPTALSANLMMGSMGVLPAGAAAIAAAAAAANGNIKHLNGSHSFQNYATSSATHNPLSGRHPYRTAQQQPQQQLHSSMNNSATSQGPPPLFENTLLGGSSNARGVGGAAVGRQTPTMTSSGIRVTRVNSSGVLNSPRGGGPARNNMNAITANAGSLIHFGGNGNQNQNVHHSSRTSDSSSCAASHRGILGGGGITSVVSVPPTGNSGVTTVTHPISADRKDSSSNKKKAGVGLLSSLRKGSSTTMRDSDTSETIHVSAGRDAEVGSSHNSPSDSADTPRSGEEGGGGSSSGGSISHGRGRSAGRAGNNDSPSSPSSGGTVSRNSQKANRQRNRSLFMLLIAALVAIGAAVGSGVFLYYVSVGNLRSQAATKGKAVVSSTLSQLNAYRNTMVDASESLVRYVDAIDPDTTDPDSVIRSLNASIYSQWTSRITQASEMYGWALAFLYPKLEGFYYQDPSNASAPQKFIYLPPQDLEAQTFAGCPYFCARGDDNSTLTHPDPVFTNVAKMEIWYDVLKDGEREYVYSALRPGTNGTINDAYSLRQSYQHQLTSAGGGGLISGASVEKDGTVISSSLSAMHLDKYLYPLQPVDRNRNGSYIRGLWAAPSLWTSADGTSYYFFGYDRMWVRDTDGTEGGDESSYNTTKRQAIVTSVFDRVQRWFDAISSIVPPNSEEEFMLLTDGNGKVLAFSADANGDPRLANCSSAFFHSQTVQESCDGLTARTHPNAFLRNLYNEHGATLHAATSATSAEWVDIDGKKYLLIVQEAVNSGRLRIVATYAIRQAKAIGDLLEDTVAIVLVSVAIVLLASIMLIVIGAVAVRQQAQTIRVVARLTRYISKYDVDGAQQFIDEKERSGEISNVLLQREFQLIVDNLRLYQSFLPRNLIGGGANTNTDLASTSAALGALGSYDSQFDYDTHSLFAQGDGGALKGRINIDELIAESDASELDKNIGGAGPKKQHRGGGDRDGDGGTDSSDGTNKESGGSTVDDSDSVDLGEDAPIDNLNTNRNQNKSAATAKVLIDPITGERKQLRKKKNHRSALHSDGIDHNDDDEMQNIDGDQYDNGKGEEEDAAQGQRRIFAAHRLTAQKLRIVRGSVMLVDYGNLSTSNPSEAAECINSFVAIAIPIIERFGGVVDLMQANQLLVTFNYHTPVVKHEDIAAKCALVVKAALNMDPTAAILPPHQNGDKLPPTAAHRFLTTLGSMANIAIAITSGPNVVGTVGTDATQKSRIVAGEGVDMAKKLIALQRVLGASKYYSNAADHHGSHATAAAASVKKALSGSSPTPQRSSNNNSHHHQKDAASSSSSDVGSILVTETTLEKCSVLGVPVDVIAVKWLQAGRQRSIAVYELVGVGPGFQKRDPPAWARSILAGFQLLRKRRYEEAVLQLNGPADSGFRQAIRLRAVCQRHARLKAQRRLEKERANSSAFYGGGGGDSSDTGGYSSSVPSDSDRPRGTPNSSNKAAVSANDGGGGHGYERHETFFEQFEDETAALTTIKDLLKKQQGERDAKARQQEILQTAAGAAHMLGIDGTSYDPNAPLIPASSSSNSGEGAAEHPPAFIAAAGAQTNSSSGVLLHQNGGNSGAGSNSNIAGGGAAALGATLNELGTIREGLLRQAETKANSGGGSTPATARQTPSAATADGSNSNATPAIQHATTTTTSHVRFAPGTVDNSPATSPYPSMGGGGGGKRVSSRSKRDGSIHPSIMQQPMVAVAPAQLEEREADDDMLFSIFVPQDQQTEAEIERERVANLAAATTESAVVAPTANRRVISPTDAAVAEKKEGNLADLEELNKSGSSSGFALFAIDMDVVNEDGNANYIANNVYDQTTQGYNTTNGPTPPPPPSAAAVVPAVGVLPQPSIANDCFSQSSSGGGAGGLHPIRGGGGGHPMNSPRVSYQQVELLDSGEMPTHFTDINGQLYTRSRTILGRGAFGFVTTAMDDDGTIVAVKTMSLEGARATSVGESAEAALRARTDALVHEVGVLAEVRHANIAGYVSAAILPSHFCIIMEYLSGGSLRTLISGSHYSRLPTRPLMSYLRGILRGLQYLHEVHNYVHCDIKPDNVMLTSDGTCKLTDFGTAVLMKKEEEVEQQRLMEQSLADNPESLAQSGIGMDDSVSGGLGLFAGSIRMGQRSRPKVVVASSSAAAASPTQQKTSAIPQSQTFNHNDVSDGPLVRGTPRYMAPEAALGDWTPATDVYSLGITVIELATGQHPWRHVSGNDTTFLMRLAMDKTMRPLIPPPKKKEASGGGGNNNPLALASSSITPMSQSLTNSPNTSSVAVPMDARLIEFAEMCLAYEPLERATVQQLLLFLEE